MTNDVLGKALSWAWRAQQYARPHTHALPFAEQLRAAYTTALTAADGRAYSAGYGANGHDARDTAPLCELRMPDGQRVTHLATSLMYAAAATEGGALYTWGIDSDAGRLGLGVRDDRRVATPQLAWQGSGRITALACGGEALLVCIE